MPISQIMQIAQMKTYRGEREREGDRERGVLGE